MALLIKNKISHFGLWDRANRKERRREEEKKKKKKKKIREGRM